MEPYVGHLTEPVHQHVMHVWRDVLLVAEGVVGAGRRAALEELSDLWKTLDLGTPEDRGQRGYKHSNTLKVLNGGQMAI